MKPRRVLLKISGEALLGPSHVFPYDPETVFRIAQEIKQAHEAGVEIGVVIGGGNIFRGATGASRGMNRTMADWFGMLATIQNGIVFLDFLERVCGVETRLMSGLRCDSVAEPYLTRKAVHHLKSGRVVILAGGTGNPYCTTDYGAALRANELGADLLAKATNTDGLYDKDPKYPDAKFLPTANYEQCIRDRLKVMDIQAFALCRDHQMPIRIFSIQEEGNITAVLQGADIGSLISDAAEYSNVY